MSNRFTEENRDLILDLVCEEFVTDKKSVLSPSRCRREAAARHMAMALMRVLLKCSVTEVGKVFGRHYTMVVTALKKVEEDRELMEVAVRLGKQYKARFSA
jgi:chromosomal replication initiation ATPase DnaA